MTTIACRNGVIAYDGRETVENVICRDDLDKKYEYEDVLFFLAGSVDEIPYFIEACLGRPDREQYDCCGFMVRGGEIYELYSNAIPIPFTMEYWAFGSGACFALAGMDCGLSSKEAVKLAAKRDTCTGGRIRTYKVKV